jgi:hypothetical protein
LLAGAHAYAAAGRIDIRCRTVRVSDVDLPLHDGHERGVAFNGLGRYRL